MTRMIRNCPRCKRYSPARAFFNCPWDEHFGDDAVCKSCCRDLVRIANRKDEIAHEAKMFAADEMWSLAPENDGATYCNAGRRGD